MNVPGRGICRTQAHRPSRTFRKASPTADGWCKSPCGPVAPAACTAKSSASTKTSPSRCNQAEIINLSAVVSQSGALRCGLVEPQHGGIVDQLERHRESLLLPARQPLGDGELVIVETERRQNILNLKRQKSLINISLTCQDVIEAK